MMTRNLKLLILLGLSISGCEHIPRTGDASNATSQSSIDQLCKLIQQSAKDSENINRRNSMTGDRALTKFAGERFWESLYPVNYARAKIMTRGQSIVRDLHTIAFDPTKSELLRISALNFIGALNGLDEPGMLARLLEEQRRGRLALNDLYWTISASLPIDNWKDVRPLAPSGIVAWLESELRTKTYEQIILSLLDEMMKPQRYRITPGDFFFRHFLNRMNGQDLDDWLAKRSPTASQFREKELSKGYDPVDQLVDYLTPFYFDGNLAPALTAIYSDPRDQQGCRELVEVFADTHIANSEKDAWEDRFRAWYKANREFLIYDRQKHRFVVKERKTGRARLIEQALGSSRKRAK